MFSQLRQGLLTFLRHNSLRHSVLQRFLQRWRTSLHSWRRSRKGTPAVYSKGFASASAVSKSRQKETSQKQKDLLQAALSDRTATRDEIVNQLNQTLRSPAAERSEKLVSSRTMLRKSNAGTTTSDSSESDSSEFLSQSERPDLVKSLADSAYICECQGRFNEAERLYKQAAGLSIRRFGKSHSAIVPHLSALSALYYSQTRYAKAAPLLSIALKIQRRSQAASHPDIGETCAQLGNIYVHLQHYRQAEYLLQSALQTFRRAYGFQHVRTERVYCDLMRLIAIAIESGRFEEISAELQPLNPTAPGETYRWARPAWLDSKTPADDYSWIKLIG